MSLADKIDYLVISYALAGLIIIVGMGLVFLWDEIRGRK